MCQHHAGLARIDDVPDIADSEVDAARVEAFGQGLLEILNHAGTALMISIGHRTGLFDALAELPPSDSREIAQAAGLQERYVREWLATMTVSGIVLFDPVERTYHLPAEHAALLTRAAAPSNMAVTTQYLGVLASVEDDVVRCFSEGGGVPYSRYGRFHEVMAEDSGQTAEALLVDSALPLVDGLTERLEAGIDVLDLGCGAGRALLLLARRFPRSRFVGYDVSPEPIARAVKAAQNAGLDNVRFEVRDAAKLAETARWDLVTTFDAIHDQADPARVLANIRRALRPDGVYLMQDIAGSSHLEQNMEHPLGAFLYTVSCMHCMTVSLAEGGVGLGTLWGHETALEMLADAGFGPVETHRLEDDLVNAYYVARPAANDFSPEGDRS